MFMGLNLRIESKQPNPLLARTDVRFALSFDGGVPARKEVRSALATALSVPSERVVLIRLSGSSGLRACDGLAHVYETPEAALRERRHLLVRDGLAQKAGKKEAPKKATKAK